MDSKEFWYWHLLVSMIVFVFLALIFELSHLDLWFADRLFELEGHAWTLKSNWLTYNVIHQDGKRAMEALGLAAFLFALASWKFGPLKPYRKSLIYLFSALVLIPSAIALLKHFSEVPCPWNLKHYGAARIYAHSLSYSLGTGHGGHCFPSGHASAAYALLALYFAAYPHVARKKWLFLIPGVLLGITFGLAQQLRGAHFMSHDIWTAFLSWFISLLLFSL